MEIPGSSLPETTLLTHKHLPVETFRTISLFGNSAGSVPGALIFGLRPLSSPSHGQTHRTSAFAISMVNLAHRTAAHRWPRMTINRSTSPCPACEVGIKEFYNKSKATRLPRLNSRRRLSRSVATHCHKALLPLLRLDTRRARLLAAGGSAKVKQQGRNRLMPGRSCGPHLTNSIL